MNKLYLVFLIVCASMLNGTAQNATTPVAVDSNSKLI